MISCIAAVVMIFININNLPIFICINKHILEDRYSCNVKKKVNLHKFFIIRNLLILN